MKKYLFIMIASALAVGIIMTASSKAQIQATKQVVEITRTTINLRQGPGVSYPIAGKATLGQTFDLLTEQGKWLKISLPDTFGEWNKIAGVLLLELI